MYPDGFTAEVTCLSPRVTEKEIHDFFSHCGEIEYVDIIRSGDYACSAYVTFRDAYALRTAVLLSGATIGDQRVHIAHWGAQVDDSYPWNKYGWQPGYQPGYGNSSTENETDQHYPTPGEAVNMAQEVVKTMIAEGYVLSKGALAKAKAFDNSYQVSSSAAAKVAELEDRFGITDKIFAGVEAVRCVDGRYHVSENTRTAANAVVNSSYFSKGALWVSDALTRAAKVASDLGTHSRNN